MARLAIIGLFAAGADARRTVIHATQLVAVSNATVQTTHGLTYGQEACPCVGLDKLEGVTTVQLADHSKASYPADLGGRCEAWDKDHHKDCPGKDFCTQAWCFVDPCNCKTTVLPKPSVYLPDAKYHGRPVHFSYVTCGAKDEYTGKEDDSRQTWTKDIQQTCSIKPDAAVWGNEKCRCIGIGPQPGTTKVTIDGKSHDFPADTGAMCKAWETGNHPDCSGASAPEWCTQKWCYVDPCSCNMEDPPKTTSYLPEAKYQGKPVYYSYSACGSADSFTGTRKEACVNMKKKEDCTKLDKCAWTPDNKCLGKELVEVCHGGASQLKYIFALALPLLSLFQ